jgi:hypothetical protein
MPPFVPFRSHGISLGDHNLLFAKAELDLCEMASRWQQSAATVEIRSALNW